MSKTFFSWHKEDFGFLNPYIIAEIGVNHGGDLSLAKEQICLAKNAGAHAVKFQMYKASSLASKDHSPAYWDLTKETTPSQYDLFQKYDKFSPTDYQDLFYYCQEMGIDFSCTPFDLQAVEILDPLLQFFKIASADITNIPLLRKIAKTKKPVMLSVGASQFEEIDQAVDILSSGGCQKLALLHCVLNYPTPPEHAQMFLQDELAKRYGSKCLIGYSDHVVPSSDGELPALDFSVLRGAVIIEKHFTHDPTLPGNDHYHAASPKIFERWVKKLELFRALYGHGSTRNLEWEKAALHNARRRIYLTKDKFAGEVLLEEDIVALRGNQGVEIAHYDDVIGKTLKEDKKKDDHLSGEDIGLLIERKESGEE